MLLLIIIFLLLSALFSGSEIAFVSANKLRVEVNRKRGDRQGRIIANFFDNPTSFLSTMLVGNNIALVIFTYLMTQLLSPLWDPYVDNELLLLLINTMIITIVVLIFGEYLPKTVFALFADKFIRALAYPLLMLKYILMMPAMFMTWVSNILLYRVFRIGVQEGVQHFSRIELASFVKSTIKDSDMTVNTELFGRALFMEDTRVRDRMIPRQDIKYIDIAASVEDLKSLFVSTKLSRVLVCSGDLDTVRGYVHHQQLLEKPVRVIGMRMHAVQYIPEQMKIRDVLNQFIKQNLSLALVVDEYGSTTGLITLEDLLEEIFGEIIDEHDQEEFIEEKKEEGIYQFSGRLETDYLNENYELGIPDGDYNTLSGYLLTAFTHMPESGDEIVLGNHRYRLQIVNLTHISTVIVEKIPDESQESTE